MPVARKLYVFWRREEIFFSSVFFFVIRLKNRKKGSFTPSYMMYYGQVKREPAGDTSCGNSRSAMWVGKSIGVGLQ